MFYVVVVQKKLRTQDNSSQTAHKFTTRTGLNFKFCVINWRRNGLDAKKTNSSSKTPAFFTSFATTTEMFHLARLCCAPNGDLENFALELLWMYMIW